LQEKTEKIGHLDSALQGLKEHQKSKDEIIEELRAEIQDCSIRKKRADILLKGLSAEKQKWIVCTRMLASKYTSLLAISHSLVDSVKDSETAFCRNGQKP
jgi:hypothetical protein